MSTRVVKPVRPFLNLWRMLTPALRKRFVLVLKSSAGTVRQYAEGRRGISPAVAARIEKASVMLGGDYPRLNRMDLNETCRNCEFAIACRGPMPGRIDQTIRKAKVKRTNTLPRVRK
jgi:hypothetical protein